MADLIEEVSLPSRGLVYATEVKWNNQLRAPRLADKGIGDLTKKNKLQAGILDKTLMEPLGISAYDLHTADFLYLNVRQRLLSKGNKPYKVKVKCSRCGFEHVIDINLAELEVKQLKEKPDYTFKTLDEKVIEYKYLTPRAFDDARDAADQYKEDFPDADQDVYLQELLRRIIVTIDGVKPTHSQMTGLINNLYISDVDDLLAKVMNVEFGVVLDRSMKCTCGKKIEYTIPV